VDVKPIRTPIIQVAQDLLPILTEALAEPLQNGDIICITSKVVALAQGRVVKLSEIEPSPEALSMERLRYSKDFTAHPELAELVLREADEVFVGEGGLVYLTLKDHVFIANAGIDLSNAPDGHAILWPEEPWAWAREFRARLMTSYDLDTLGVLLTDSHLTPLRRGVTGLAMAYAGFEGIESEIGEPDLFCRPLQVTERAIADDLAAAAVLVCGEAAEATPFALVRGAPAIFTDRDIDPREVFVDPKIDLYAGIYNEDFKTIVGDL
jgi:coenzyme F420-0:L-glutamate ligase